MTTEQSSAVGRRFEQVLGTILVHGVILLAVSGRPDWVMAWVNVVASIGVWAPNGITLLRKRRDLIRAFVPTGSMVSGLAIRGFLDEASLQNELEGHRRYASPVRFGLVQGAW